MITRKHLPRRTFLRGLGTAIALPLLDSMVPAFGGPTVAKAAPCRMAFTYVPNGIVMSDWTPKAVGAISDLPRILEPLSAYKSDMLLLSGLTQNGGRALGDGPGDHARAAASFLTGVHPKKTAGADIHVGISVDQVAAQAVGQATKFASIELGCEDGRQVGNCDSGYSCAYSNSISWRTASTPMPPEINPRMVFERLFAGIDLSEDAATRAKSGKYRKSILDFALEDTQRLKSSLGATDKRKIDEYLDAVRQIEKRIQATEHQDGKDVAPNLEVPAGIPVDFQEHARLMFDLQVVAFQTDSTRIATFMMGREGSGRSYREIGVSDAHHSITHHRGDETMIEKVRKINRYHVEQFAYFVDKLKNTPDGDGSLLDHTMVVYGSGLSDGNRHQHNDLPVLIVGRGSGLLKPGRHVQYAPETPMNNLFMAMLDRMGVRPESIGDSKGKLEHLTDL
ncbi:MAG TPA: DUF1552 domain-containing protein [Bryobacteraceae bacterium]|nr:DUF1552 domain-containing protein [Bryobacteraceae bacterium]